MPVIFQDNEFIVENRFFTGWFVTDRFLKTRRKPTIAVSAQIGLTWFIVRRHKYQEQHQRRAAENALMLSFALAVMNPGTEYESEFLAPSPEDLAHEIICFVTQADY